MNEPPYPHSRKHSAARWTGVSVSRRLVLIVLLWLCANAAAAAPGKQPTDRLRDDALALHARVLKHEGPLLLRYQEYSALLEAAALGADTLTLAFVNRIGLDLGRWTTQIMDEVYTVNPGDCLWNIARRKGTDPFLWTYIFQANDSLIVNPDRIFPNQMLRLPGPILNQPPAPAFALHPVKIPAVLLPVVVLVNDSTKQEQQEKTEEPPRGSDIEIDGLVIDETQSKLGREFYERFYAAWRAPAGVRNFTIIISERLLPSFGTQLTLKVNDTEIFQRFLQPREELIEEAVSTAVAGAQDFLKNYDQMQKEAQGRDMKGNGIY